MRPAVIMFAGALALRAAAHGAEFNVATNGRDSNAGTSAAPFRTIQHAADVAQPCDVITVHAGVYRERIDPPRGGTDDAHRITYQAAPGEKVAITGAEPVKGWVKVTNDTWQVILPNSRFGSFNPYSDPVHGDWCLNPGRYHTGAVYLNGDWLTEARKQDGVLQPAGKNALWFATVGAANTAIWAQFPGVNPNEQNVEINVRQTVFTPLKTGVNYLTVRGLELRAAAVPWAPPPAAQIGIISADWCKGWIIEHNTIHYSPCCGVALGKYGDEWDNRGGSASGYVGTIQRALATGWNQATVGGHIVRDNDISCCEQAGIVGSLGCSFSTVSGNEIHDIHIRRLYDGCEMAGIKFHGAIDAVISDNHIYRCNRGIWLDWMAQGTRITGNLLHDNAAAGVNWPANWEALVNGGEQDLFFEVNHGPILVDNNIFFSPYAVNDRSQGVAFVHNLFVGAFRIIPFDPRQTPWHKPHSTEVVALHDNPCGDHRFYNNLFVEHCNLGGFDAATLPVAMDGNLYLKGSKPSNIDAKAQVLPAFNPSLKLVERADGWYLTGAEDPAWRDTMKRKVVTTELLGTAKIPSAAYENPDGSPVRIDTDYLHHKRDGNNPFPGPFEITRSGLQEIKVWPKP